MPLLKAYIMPHPPLAVPAIGGNEIEKIGKTIAAFEKVAEEIAQLAPETIIVSSPHSIMYSDYIHISPGNFATGDFRLFGVKSVGMAKEYDDELVEYIVREAKECNLRAGTLGERDKSLDHGTMVPLYFIEQKYADYKSVRMSISGLSLYDHYEFGKCVRKAIEETNRRVVYIASGDLSHKLSADGPYGFSPDGPIFDQDVTLAIAKGDFLKFLTFSESFLESAAECGLRSFVIMAGLFDKEKVTPKLLSYEGPFGVGYGIASFEPAGADSTRDFDKQAREAETKEISKTREREDIYIRLARMSLENYVLTGKRLILPEGLPDELVRKQAGVFVSLHEHGRLRGCIGTIMPQSKSVAEEIIKNAVSAGTNDPRFDKVEATELKDIIYSVDVLELPERIASKAELDPKKYGVIVRSGYRSGLLLPNLDNVDTVEDQVNIVLRKAGIGSGENYSMERFQVTRHE